MKLSSPNKSSGFIGRATALIALATLTVMALSPVAEAALQGTAGNAVIRNTITVNYNDATGHAQTAATSFVDISVNTVAATPTILSFTPSPGSTDGTGATQAYAVRIRTNSNGPGSISFGTADGTFVNVALGTVPTVPGNIYLGSTIFDPSNFPGMGAQTIANNATLANIAVPNDNGKANDTGAAHALPDATVINGLALNDTVYITDGTTYYGPWQVTVVNDPVVGNGTTAAPGSLTLKNISGGALVFTPASGWQIVEYKDVTVTVTQGDVADATIAAHWVTTLTATMAGAAAANTPTVITNAHEGKLIVTKYVRNVTTPVAGAGLFSPPVFTNNFYTSGVNGKPGDVLEYLVVVTNTGSGSSAAVLATDVMPTYSTLLTGSAYGTPGGGTIFAQANFNTTGAVLKTDNSGGTANVAYGKSTGTAAGSTMTFYLGTGCSTSAGGTLTTGQVEYLIYQVIIN
jgi:uncharacterized repeat protein (TIGR01451 family)